MASAATIVPSDAPIGEAGNGIAAADNSDTSTNDAKVAANAVTSGDKLVADVPDAAGSKSAKE